MNRAWADLTPRSSITAILVILRRFLYVLIASKYCYHAEVTCTDYRRVRLHPDYSSGLNCHAPDWLAHVPKEVIAKNFQTSISAFNNIPSQELYIFPAGMPYPLLLCKENTLTSSFCTQLLLLPRRHLQILRARYLIHLHTCFHKCQPRSTVVEVQRSSIRPRSLLRRQLPPWKLSWNLAR